MTEIPFGYVKEGKIYRTGWSDFPDKEIGEVRDDNIEKSTEFFQERFTDLESKVIEVTTKIDESENKGSFLMKLVHLRDQLPEHDGLGDYSTLRSKIDQYETLVRDIIQKNRERNTEIKTALIEEAGELEDIVNWKEATEKAHDLKARWIKTGSAEEEKNEELETSFWGIVTHFFDRKKQFYEDKQKLIVHRQNKYEELVQEAQNLGALRGKERFDKVKDLKARWKENGGIPSEQYQPLHDAFYKALKGGKKPFTSNVDYTGVLSKLEEIKKGTIPFNKEEIDAIKKSTFRDKARSQEKFKVLNLIPILSEREFVMKLAYKRFPDYAKLEMEKKQNVKRGILNDLIQRDKEDLKIYEENSANFSSSDGSMNKLVENKIKGQKKKIEVKTQLLEWIDSGEF